MQPHFRRFLPAVICVSLLVLTLYLVSTSSAAPRAPASLTVQGVITLNGQPVSGYAHLRCGDKTEVHVPLVNGGYILAVPSPLMDCTFFATDMHQYTSSTRTIPAGSTGIRTINDEIWWGGWPWNVWQWCAAPDLHEQ